MIFTLFKIFLSNIYSFSDFFEGFKKGPKGIFKNIFLILCFAYLIGVFGLIYVMFTINTYASLEYIGQIDLFPGIALMLAFLLVFNFGIISVGVSYYAGTGEEQFLSMPITPKEFFGAKFGVSLVDNAISGVLLFAISAGYFGYKQGLLTNPLFYLGTIITILVSSIVVILVIYFLFVTLLYFIPAFRKKTILNGISSVFIMIIALGIGFASGELGAFTTMGDGEIAVTEMMSGLSGKVIVAAESNSIFKFFGRGIKGNMLPILILLIIGAVSIFVLVPLLSKMYIKTFEGVSDIKQKKISKEKLEKVVSSETKRNSIFKAMFLRDVKGVLREPTFFANGPLGVILFPSIFIFSICIPFIFDGDTISDLRIVLQEYFAGEIPEKIERVKYFICFGLAAFTVFCGSITSVAATSFSREGKGFCNIKAMPIRNEIIVKVKFFHACLYTLISCLITTIIFLAIKFILQLPFSFVEMASIILVMILVSSAISVLLIILDMLFDTVNPKLNWENPVGAMKQNMNSVFALLVSFAALGLYSVMGILWGLFLEPTLLALVGIGLFFGIIAAPVGAAYFKYADKKIPLM